MKTFMLPREQKCALEEIFAVHGDFAVQGSNFALVAQDEFNAYIKFKEDLATRNILLEREDELQSPDTTFLPSAVVISNLRKRIADV